MSQFQDVFGHREPSRQEVDHVIDAVNENLTLRGGELVAFMALMSSEPIAENMGRISHDFASEMTEIFPALDQEDHEQLFRMNFALTTEIIGRLLLTVRDST